MNYPLISEYIDAILAAEDNFEELNHLRPVIDNDGKPVMTSGNFAVVFKMQDEQNGTFHAIKCFLKDQDGRSDAYRLITEELNGVNSSYLTPIQYLESELFVDSVNSEETEFPILLMDWVEGETLDKYVFRNKYDGKKLSCLVRSFYELSTWLLSQPFAHGDLKPDNIIVTNDGNLVLIDYDGMYVPKMFGQPSREQGSPNYRRPHDPNDNKLIDFGKDIDDFAIIHLLLSLQVYSTYPHLLKPDKEFALFDEKEFHNFSNCKTYNDIITSKITPQISILLNILQKLLLGGSICQEEWNLLHFSETQNNYVNMEEQMCSLDNIVLAVELAYSSMVYKDPARNEFNSNEYCDRFNRLVLATEIQEDLKNHEWQYVWGGIKYSRFKSNGIEKREGIVYELRQYALRYLFGIIKYQVVKSELSQNVFGGEKDVFSPNFDENKYESYLEDFVKIQEQCSQQYRYLYVFDIRNFFSSVNNSILKDIYWGSDFFDVEWFDELYNIVFDSNIIRGLNPCSEIDFFFANLYLKSLDEKLARYEGIKYYRYCDDIRIFSNNRDLMEPLSNVITSILTPLKLQLNTEKTKIIDTSTDKIELSKACFVYSSRLYLGGSTDILLEGKNLVEIINNDLTTIYISRLLKSVNRTAMEEDGSLDEHLNNMFYILKNVHKNAALYKTVSTLIFDRGIDYAQNMLIFSDILKRTVDLLKDEEVEPFVKYWVLRTFFCSDRQYYKLYIKAEEPWKYQVYYTRPCYMDQISDLLNGEFRKADRDKLLYHLSDYIVRIIDPFKTKEDELPF